LCSNRAATQIRAGGKLDIEKHREQIRSLVAEAPDEPTYCEFKKLLSYATKKEKGELVKDVSSFANADLEALGGYGYMVFGVSNDGQVVGIENTSGDSPSAVWQIVNGHLGRPVVFEYITCEVGDKTGGRKRVGALVVPDSKIRPHVVSKEIKEPLSKNRDKFWLREGEVWVRKAGGRELATAEDLDVMYEGKLRRMVDDGLRPLQQRVERLERDLHERTSATPKPDFGFAVPNSWEPSQELRPYPALGNLINAEGIQAKIERVKKQAAEAPKVDSVVPRFTNVGPTAKDYEEYAQELQEWLIKVHDVFYINFVFVNTGVALAEDVQVILTIPAVLKPGTTLPAKPSRPSIVPNDVDRFIPSVSAAATSSIRSRPDRILGPNIGSEDASGRVTAVWEVRKLYHDRPLFTRTTYDLKTRLGRNGLFISGKGLRQLQSQAGGGAQLNYTIRAANVPETLHGVLVLR